MWAMKSEASKGGFPKATAQQIAKGGMDRHDMKFCNMQKTELYSDDLPGVYKTHYTC